MTTIGQLERHTQNRVVMLLANQLGWQYIQLLKSGDNLDQVIIETAALQKAEAVVGNGAALAGVDGVGRKTERSIFSFLYLIHKLTELRMSSTSVYYLHRLHAQILGSQIIVFIARI